MLGFGVRLNQVFASRWKAVLWSLGVLLTAYCTVPDRVDPDAKGDHAQVIKIPDLTPEQPAME
ncbi:hypothetical protein [Novosphingobium sp.]|uniref:hypothetical protein n=1 Tax=Novosphingobium sp. TaxID=1874826 RepID=UPI00286C2B57|nr:hypothetical protein [Novosphingobium sp.]